jgi:hypothetical protein
MDSARNSQSPVPASASFGVATRFLRRHRPSSKLRRREYDCIIPAIHLAFHSLEAFLDLRLDGFEIEARAASISANSIFAIV